MSIRSFLGASRAELSRRFLQGPRVHSILGPMNYERLQFKRRLGYWPNLQNPVTFQEKVAWRKFYEDMSDATVLADKVSVRDYVGSTAGNAYLTDVIAVADRVDDIDFESLPQRFMMKASHGSGMNIRVLDRSSTDLGAARERLGAFLSRTYGRLTNESWYAGIKPRIIVEPLLVDDVFGEPLDYKFYVFHGKAHFLHVDVDRFRCHRQSFFDLDWRLMPFTRGFEPAPEVEPPARLGEMVEVAEALAGDWGFVRVDLYCLNDREVRFGEMTFAPAAGRRPFRPLAYNETIGSLWDITRKRRSRLAPAGKPE